jgi:hypothetical protein
VVDGRSSRHWLLADTDEANAAARKIVVIEKVFIFLGEWIVNELILILFVFVVY